MIVITPGNGQRIATPTINTNVSVLATASVQLASHVVFTLEGTNTAPPGGGNIWINTTGGAAVVGSGIKVVPGQPFVISAQTVSVNAISDSGTIVVPLSGG